MIDKDLLMWATTIYTESAAALARNLKISDQVISNWKRKEAIPTGWRMYLLVQLNKTAES